MAKKTRRFLDYELNKKTGYSKGMPETRGVPKDLSSDPQAIVTSLDFDYGDEISIGDIPSVKGIDEQQASQDPQYGPTMAKAEAMPGGYQRQEQPQESSDPSLWWLPLAGAVVGGMLQGTGAAYGGAAQGFKGWQTDETRKYKEGQADEAREDKLYDEDRAFERKKELIDYKAENSGSQKAGGKEVIYEGEDGNKYYGFYDPYTKEVTKTGVKVPDDVDASKWETVKYYDPELKKDIIAKVNPATYSKGVDGIESVRLGELPRGGGGKGDLQERKFEFAKEKERRQVKKDFTNDTEVKASREQYKAANFVENLLNQKTAILDQWGLRQVFRLSGDVGVIRKEDLEQLGTSPEAIEQVRSSIMSLKEGETIAPPQRQQLLWAANLSKKAAELEVNRRANQIADLAILGEGESKKDVINFLNPTAELGNIEFPDYEGSRSSFEGSNNNKSPFKGVKRQIINPETGEEATAYKRKGENVWRDKDGNILEGLK